MANQKYTDEMALQFLTNWETAKGPGSTLRRDKLRREAGIPTYAAAQGLVARARALRAGKRRPRSTPAVQPQVTASLTDGRFLDWLSAASRETDVPQESIDSLLVHWLRWSRQV